MDVWDEKVHFDFDSRHPYRSPTGGVAVQSGYPAGLLQPVHGLQFVK